MRLPFISPLLFTLGFMLSFYAYNVSEVEIREVVGIFAVIIIAVAIILFAISFRNKDKLNDCLIFSIFILLFFSLGYVRDLLSSVGLVYIGLFGLNLQNQIVLFPLFVLVFIAVAIFIEKSKRDFGSVVVFLNVVSIAFVVIPLANIVVYESGVNKESKNMQVPSYSTDNPDIYYIILDGYARADALQDCYGYDNSEFISYLESKGFYIADNSTSNYNTTCLSMPSTLNMEYLDPTGGKYAKMGWGDNKVEGLLKSKGYKYTYVTGNTYIKGMEEAVDEYLGYKPQINDFSYGFMQTTMIYPVYKFFVLNSGVPDMLSQQYRESVLYTFNKVKEIPRDNASTFVYMHVLCPHPPYIFGEDGSPANQSNGSMLQEGLLWQPDNPKSQFEGHETGYIPQVKFINSKVKETIDYIMDKSQGKAIIIIQADHGMRIQKDRCYDILNAYYFPDRDYSTLYPSISPVNSFRVLFNKYFDTEYELLLDEMRVIE